MFVERSSTSNSLDALMMVLLRKSAVLTLGIIVVVIGVALLVLPGPGVLVIAAGLGILSIEFPWAKRLIEKAKVFFKQLRRQNQERMVRRRRRSADLP